MKALIVQMQTQQPVLVAHLGAGEENSSETTSYIPGSALRGAVIDLYLQRHPDAAISHDAHCRELFFDGACCYLNGYPTSSEGKRSLPRPFSWRVSKDDNGDQQASLYDFAVDVEDTLQTPQLPRQTFVTCENGAFAWAAPARRTIQVHNASDERLIKKSQSSQVFRYEAIAANECFTAAIISQSTDLLEEIRPLLTDATIGLGRARSAGYGLTRITRCEMVDDWRETPPQPLAGDHLFITLLSDVILRDAFGQPATNLDALLGCAHTQAFQKTAVTGGFNRKWGLPLPQSLSIQAGSVFKYPAGKISPDALVKLVECGVGERRAEGFGRIAVNLNRQARVAIASPASAPPEKPTPPPHLSKESHQLATQMAERALRALLDNKLVVAANQLKFINPPEKSQLSALRLAARKAQASGKLNMISDHIKSLKSAKDQFEGMRIGIDRTEKGGATDKDQHFLYWLENEEKKQAASKEWFSIPDDEYLKVAGVTAAMSSELQVIYVARLIDALCKKAVKTSQALEKRKETKR